MSRKRYTSDLTDQEWAIIEPRIPPAKDGGRPRTVNLREVVNAIFYVLKTGCQWANLPGDFPASGMVFDYYNTWRKEKVWQRLNDALSGQVRLSAGRDVSPSAAIIDSQSVKTTEKRGQRGYDGGKHIKGRKRFLLVDTLGLVMKVLVVEAHVGEREGAEWLLTSLGDRFPRQKLIWADGGFSGEDFIQRILDKCQLRLEIVKRSDDVKGFVLLPRRWVVERSLPG